MGQVGQSKTLRLLLPFILIVMRQMKDKSFISLVLIWHLFFSPFAMADELAIPFVVKDACPFEGCTFGMWEVLKDVSVYKDPNSNSEIVHKLRANTTANVETGIIKVVPGRAKIVGKPYKTASSVEPNKEILILDYIGEGYSRIYQGGTFYRTKVARKKGQCSKEPNWRYCWVEVLEEPVVKWWVKVRSGKIGWVLMEDDVLKPIDSFSQNLPYNYALHADAKQRRCLPR